ncbi:hypothetical protein AB0O90_04870 [Microbacterium testaceum]|uniref:hypothetical protein n=1 Tax=Microbacterium testaceum TaxID=2033 RepID=UPI00342F4AA2
MTKTFDYLAQEVLAATTTLSLVTSDSAVVADEEREAISRVVALVQGWSIEDRRRR